MTEKFLQPTDPKEVSAINGKPLLPPSNRIVVFGSRLSGAYDLAEALEGYLKVRGIPGASVIVERNIAQIVSTFFGRREELGGDTLPNGVIVLPEMRWYQEGRGMFVDTHSGELYADKKHNTVLGYIKSICDKNGVPIVDFNNDPTKNELILGLDKLLTAPDEKQP